MNHHNAALMNPLHRARRHVQFVLVWLALALAAAAASPLLTSQRVALVCGASGQIKALLHSDAGDAVELGAGHLDCPLCLPTGAPGPLPVWARPAPAPSLIAAGTPAAAPAGPVALPWHARAPPLPRA